MTKQFDDMHGTKWEAAGGRFSFRKRFFTFLGDTTRFLSVLFFLPLNLNSEMIKGMYGWMDGWYGNG